MKKSSFAYAALLVLWIALLAPASSSSQTTSSFSQKQTAPKPETGFWQVITRDAEPRMVTVQFYDLAQHLVYEERLTDVTLDLHKKKTRRVLNGILHMALTSRDRHKPPVDLALQRALR